MSGTNQIKKDTASSTPHTLSYFRYGFFAAVAVAAVVVLSKATGNKTEIPELPWGVRPSSR